MTDNQEAAARPLAGNDPLAANNTDSDFNRAAEQMRRTPFVQGAPTRPKIEPIVQDRDPVAVTRRVTLQDADRADERGAMLANVFNAALKHGERALWNSGDYRRYRIVLRVLDDVALGTDAARQFAGVSADSVQTKHDATINAVAVALGVVPGEDTP